MGKNKNNKPAKAVVPEAPATEPVVEPEVVNENKKPINVIDANGLTEQLNHPTPGLDANHTVDLLNGLDRHFMQPNAAQKLGISQESVDKVNAFSAHGWVIVAATEGMFGTSEFAKKVRESSLPGIISAAHDMNINIDMKALPAPDAEGMVAIPSTAIKPSKEAKEQIKEEQAILAKKPEVDPTKIENEDQLREALLFIMADRANTIDKIKDSIAFYRSYLAIKADNDEAKAKEAAKTDLDILGEIRNIAKKSPLVLSGIGRSMSSFTGSSKSPITAFCMFKNAVKNRKTGEYALTDKEIADYTRFLVSWTNDLTIENYEARVAEHEKNLKELNKNKKNNAKGIEDVQNKIAECKKSIEHLKEVNDYLTVPEPEIVDTLNDKYAEKDRIATSIFKIVLSTYYPDVDLEKANVEDVKHNVQQRAGIILNLFRNSTTPIVAYSEANLTEMPKKEVEEGKESKK